jgi:hypothetical protein
MYVHEELALDVLGRESTKAEDRLTSGFSVRKMPNLLNFIEDDTAGLSYSEQPYNSCYDNQKTQQLPV